MPCGIASSPERGSFWYGTFLMRENAASRCGPSGESVSVAVRRPRQTRNKKRFSAEYGHSEAEAILNQNYELFTYPCLRRHKLLRLSGAAQRAQCGGHLSGCAGSGAGLTARYQGLQPHRCRGARAGLSAEFSRRHPHPGGKAAAGAEPAPAPGHPGAGSAGGAGRFPRPLCGPH